ncbi:MAG TPA: helix-hairpin-helix domain-containing protein [Methanosarcinales archaeon]|nr:helix-hairpin-helix domain-containing protein [Methanosarcinales archaeon]
MNERNVKILIVTLLVISFITTALLILYDADFKMDINTATKSEIMSLPGIGEVLATRIIDGRPYKHIDELIEIKGIGEVRLEQIKLQAVVKWNLKP